MRVVCMWSDSEFVPACLLNAGKCFLDIAQRSNDEKARATAIVAGMKLLAECAYHHKGTQPGSEAAQTYRAKKTEFEAAKKLLGEDEGGGEDGETDAASAEK
jgi:hypothetical protein